MVFISEPKDEHALIYEGPVQGGYPREWTEASDLSLLDKCWELPLIQRAEAEETGKRANAHAFLNLIESRYPHRGRLLDIGTFCGFFLAAARSRGWSVVGLEPLVGPSIYARGRFGVDVVTDTLRWDTFSRESFDVITSFQVFEHLPYPDEALSIAYGLLKPGGLFVLEVPNIDHWSVRLLGKRHRHFVQDHLNFFSRATLAKFLSGKGFEDVSVTNSSRSLSLAALLTWGPRLLGLERTWRTGHGSSRWLDEKVVTLSSGDVIVGFATRPNQASPSR